MNLDDFRIKLHEYLALHNVHPNKSGMALCPLRQHTNDTKPSFSVSGKYGDILWHCFGCNSGGNIFDFASEYHGLAAEGEPGFYEVTLVQIAEQLGMDYIPSKEKIGAHRPLFNYYAAMRHIVGQLSLKPAEKFIKERGWTIDTARKFEIGVPQFPGRLINELISSFGEKFCKDNGILNPYILSKDRLIFPIFNPYGAVVALNARDLSGKSADKYINSRTNSFFRKSNVLYNYNRVRRHTGEVFIVEGATDVITMSHAGLNNTLGLLSTTLSPKQVKLLDIFDKVTFVLDYDSAGVEAVKKMTKDLPGAYIKLLPKGHDPDDFIRSNGVDAFNNLEYVSRLEFLIEVDDYSHPEYVVGKRLDDIFKAEPFTHPKLVRRLADKSGLNAGNIKESLDRRTNKAALAVLNKATEGANHVHVAILYDRPKEKKDNES